jgi:hypothetical protein
MDNIQYLKARPCKEIAPFAIIIGTEKCRLLGCHAAWLF